MAHRPHRLETLVITSVLGCHLVWGADTNRHAIGLLVFDYASLSSEVLGRAREKVTRIYADANVDVDWIEPVKDRSSLTANPTSTSTDTFIVQLMIRPHEDSRRVSGAETSESVLGRALEAGQTRGTASVFYDRVLAMAHHYHQPVEALLAFAIAHEMGHLLLPSPSHSPTGIMRAAWNGDDIRHAVLGTLTFTAGQAELIRAKVAACCGSRR